MFCRQQRFRGTEMLYVRAITQFTVYQTDCGYEGRASTIQLNVRILHRVEQQHSIILSLWSQKLCCKKKQ